MSDLLHVSQISVLSEEDRRTLDQARRWLRHVWLEATPGSIFTLDGIDHDGVYETLRRLDEMYGRTSGEPQLTGSTIGGDPQWK